jgi:hypothetical protein
LVPQGFRERLKKMLAQAGMAVPVLRQFDRQDGRIHKNFRLPVARSCRTVGRDDAGFT